LINQAVHLGPVLGNEQIYVFLIANGWDATLEKFKPRPERRDGLTVQEFAELYRKEVEFVEYPSGSRTIERYIASFLTICRLAKARRLAALTAEKVARFKDARTWPNPLLGIRLTG
jgi:hypothetical protein